MSFGKGRKPDGLDSVSRWQAGLRSPVTLHALLFWATAGVLTGCNEPWTSGEAGGQPGMEVGRAWSYARPPRVFGPEFHIVESFEHDECGRIYLIALRDLDGAQPWAYVWFSEVFLEENRLREAKAINVAPPPPRELRPEPGCYVEQLGVATLSEALVSYDNLRRAS